MKPTSFNEANMILTGVGHAAERYSANVASVEPLLVWSDGEQCVSCWQMSLRERLSSLLFGRVWLAVLSGHTQPPVYVQASREYFDSEKG